MRSLRVQDIAVVYNDHSTMNGYFFILQEKESISLCDKEDLGKRVHMIMSGYIFFVMVSFIRATMKIGVGIVRGYDAKLSHFQSPSTWFSSV